MRVLGEQSGGTGPRRVQWHGVAPPDVRRSLLPAHTGNPTRPAMFTDNGRSRHHDRRRGREGHLLLGRRHRSAQVLYDSIIECAARYRTLCLDRAGPERVANYGSSSGSSTPTLVRPPTIGLDGYADPRCTTWPWTERSRGRTPTFPRREAASPVGAGSKEPHLGIGGTRRSPRWVAARHRVHKPDDHQCGREAMATRPVPSAPRGEIAHTSKSTTGWDQPPAKTGIWVLVSRFTGRTVAYKQRLRPVRRSLRRCASRIRERQPVTPASSDRARSEHAGNSDAGRPRPTAVQATPSPEQSTQPEQATSPGHPRGPSKQGPTPASPPSRGGRTCPTMSRKAAASAWASSGVGGREGEYAA